MTKTCSIEGCDRTHYARSYCNPHYKRWWRHGDASAGGLAKGEARRWVEEVAIPYQGDDCLTFPYGTAHGYGRINIDDCPMDVHVFVLQRVKGPKPTPQHESCHTCGMGADACVNPNHLYWGTRKENVADMMRHRNHWSQARTAI